MSDYTPTTDEVRLVFTTLYNPRSTGITFAAGFEFDRWLAGVKAEAWAEGFKAGWSSPTGEMTSNPNREPASSLPDRSES